MKSNKKSKIESMNVEKIEIANEDNRRVIKNIFNGKFTARQAIIIEIKEDSILGKHYHLYDEIFYLLKGKADYKFVDVESGEEKKIEVKEGEKIKIPSKTYHEAFMPKGSVIIGLTENEYVNAQINDLKYGEK
ncbi:cupin domain-containing protein [Candidatus Pacearchaeota archaeon]|nr:cupin domain-containing protein [Candidatus Pacearchaeota archaeon]